MNITKFYCVFLFSMLLTGCSVRPWQTIKFMSYPIEKLSEIENFDDIETDCKIDNVFFYFISNGIEDSMYASKSPYSLNFVFESFEKTDLIINSMQLEFDGEMINLSEDIFPVNLTIDFPNYINSKLYSGSYKTDYLYRLEKVKEIKVVINVTIKNNGKSVTKDIEAIAEKKVKKGIFQYRF